MNRWTKQSPDETGQESRMRILPITFWLTEIYVVSVTKVGSNMDILTCRSEFTEVSDCTSFEEIIWKFSMGYQSWSKWPTCSFWRCWCGHLSLPCCKGYGTLLCRLCYTFQLVQVKSQFWIIFSNLHTQTFINFSLQPFLPPLTCSVLDLYMIIYMKSKNSIIFLWKLVKQVS